LKAGQYEILLSANNEHIANRFIKITLPLSRNPLFFIGIGILLIVFLFLIFKLKYNEKIYAKRIVDNKIDMLNKNLNPHFVFNSLNLIYNNILTENKEAALGVLLKFSKLQRNFLERSKEKHVTLSTELLFIKSYLDIEFLRYAKDISVGYQENIDPVVNLEKISIPPNILQPLIENSLKYGAIGYEGSEEKNIILEVIKKGDGVLLSIENPKDKNHSTQSTINGFGMGLAIVNERIKLFNQEMSTTYQLRHGLPASKFKMGYRVELHIE
jgi:LytS/YehU family sensor histidine kinase